MRDTYKVTDKILIAKIEGELDQHSAVRIRREIDSKIVAGCINVIFDFSCLEFMDSAGIGVIVGRYKAATAMGGTVCLAALKPQVERIVRLAAIDKVVPVFESVEDALVVQREVSNG